MPLWAMFDRVKDVGHPEEEMLSVYREHGVIRKESRDDNANQTAENRNIYQLVDRGWLIVNRMKAWQGSVGVSPFRGIVSGHYLCFRPRHDADPRYLNWLLRSAVYATEYARMSRGVRPGQIEIDNDELRNLRIALPPLEEQRRISDYLDSETQRVEVLRRLRAEQGRAVSSRFDTAWSAEIEDLGRTSGWTPLRRLLTAIADGPFGSALTSDHYSSSGARVVRLGNLGRARFRGANAAYISESYFADLRRHEVHGGDLIVAGLGDENYPLGRACVAPDDLGRAIVKADCFRLRLDRRRVGHDYAAWALSSLAVAMKVAEMSRGATRARINLSNVRDIAIPVPSLETQRDLVTKLVAERQLVDATLAASNAQQTVLAERRGALITAAVTGQIDVTTARGVDV